MKWLILVLDEDGSIERSFGEAAARAARFKKDEVRLVFCRNHVEVLSRALAPDDWRDHLGLLYDGEPMLDGVANSAFFACKYGDKQLTHSTTHVVDAVLGPGDVASCFWHAFHSTYSWHFEYPEDGVGLDTKRSWIEEWKAS